MRIETKNNLRLLAIVWSVILTVPATWLIMPVEENTFEEKRPDLLKDYITLTKKSTLSKEDMVEKQQIPLNQLYLINEPTGRNPFSVGEYALRTNVTRLKKDIVYDHTTKKSSPDKTYTLNGLTYSDTNKIAIINNTVLKEGDTVEGARLVKINNDSVLLSYKETLITLTLKEHTPQ